MWLITGGAGYIGAHVARAFVEARMAVAIVDDLSTGIKERLPPGVPFVEASCSDSAVLRDVIVDHGVTGVVHLAAHKHARESVNRPVQYWDNNVGAMLGILRAAQGTSVRHFLLSSSCSIYGAAGAVSAHAQADPLSPYARTKHTCEQALADCATELGVNWIALRYFNVIGNGDFPYAHDTSTECLVPVTVRRALANQTVTIFGTDFNTPDGTALRDYLDVRDLAAAHVAAAQHLAQSHAPVEMTLDVGTGQPLSVRDLLKAIDEELGDALVVADEGRRPGDPSAVWSHATEVREVLAWIPRYGVQSSVAAHVASLRRQSSESPQP